MKLFVFAKPNSKERVIVLESTEIRALEAFSRIRSRTKGWRIIETYDQPVVLAFSAQKFEEKEVTA